MTVRILESVTLINIIGLSVGTLHRWESVTSRMIALEISIWISFVQFCFILLWSLVRACNSAVFKCGQKRGYEIVDENLNDIDDERI